MVRGSNLKRTERDIPKQPEVPPRNRKKITECTVKAWGGPSTGFLNSIFGPPKPITSMFFPCPPARFFHAYGRVFPNPRPGFSAPTAGFFRGPPAGFSTPTTELYMQLHSMHNHRKKLAEKFVETPARFAETVMEKLRRFAEKFADKLGFDQVSLETTRIDITFHNFFRNQPGRFHGFFEEADALFHYTLGLAFQRATKSNMYSCQAENVQKHYAKLKQNRVCWGKTKFITPPERPCTPT